MRRPAIFYLQLKISLPKASRQLWTLIVLGHSQCVTRRSSISRKTDLEKPEALF
ncbi:hypothetical protein SASPL_157063 [Salvia splendens]|uniref:Uncharacterized protein n=1 Tax=Salvia splendens TaxID=180675 RepID=A0A8X8YWY8_SALSN|nr:hypothetical protein SASPL_157063 [Salvia splendens]